LKLLSRNKPVLVLLAGAFFGSAPLWAPHVQKVWGRTLFGTPDAFVFLGVTLLVSLLAAYLLPDLSVSGSGSRLLSSVSRRGVFPAIVFSLFSLVWFLYWTNQHILHSFLSSADEHSCYFLAECLRKGKLYVDLPAHADFFKVVHVGMRDGKWFSVYPLGWPLIWAMGLSFNIVDWLNPVMSSLSIFFFYLAGIRLFDRRSVVLGLLICCLNPFFMFTAASYFSHGTCLLCISVFLYSFLRWRESYRAEKDPVGWASICAVAVGYGLMTRYLTMAAVAAPFFLYHYLPVFFEWRGWKTGTFPVNLKRPRLRKSDWIAIGIVGAFMISIFYQNYLVTGKAFRPPNKYDKSWERLGFRRDYTPKDAFLYLVSRIFYLADWFAPAIVVAYLVLIGAGLAPFSSKSKQALLSSENEPILEKKVPDPFIKNLFCLGMVFIAGAYFFYYSWGGNQWGPRYYWEGMPFLCIAVADWIVIAFRDGSLRTRKFLLAFLLTSLVTSGMIFVRQAEYVEESSRQRRALYDLAERTIRKPAIVFIHGFLGSRLVFAEEDAIRNSPFLDTRILYAHDLGDRNKELMAAYFGREYYRGTYDGTLKRPKLEKIRSDKPSYLEHV
jgi:hypothetical protein